jgi:hypothetical protein
VRLLDAAYKIACSTLDFPQHVVFLEFADSGFAWTSWHRAITFGGVRYEPRALDVLDLSENVLLKAPEAKVTVKSLNAREQANADANLFRGDRVAIVVAWVSGGALYATGYQATYKVDGEHAFDEGVDLRLQTSDAVEGLLVPLYTTAEVGCQNDFRRGRCWYRPSMVHGNPFPTTELANKCDKTLDGPLGCIAHFKEVSDLTGLTFIPGVAGKPMRIPMPYFAFPGSLPRYFA